MERPDPDPRSDPAPDEWIEVWREADGFWRWRYRNAGERVDLLSNEGHPTLEQAVAAARTAYPGVKVIEPHPALPRRTNVGAALRAAGLAVLAVAGLLVGMVALPVVAAVKLRRLLRQLLARLRPAPG